MALVDREKASPIYGLSCVLLTWRLAWYPQSFYGSSSCWKLQGRIRGDWAVPSCHLVVNGETAPAKRGMVACFLLNLDHWHLGLGSWAQDAKKKKNHWEKHKDFLLSSQDCCQPEGAAKDVLYISDITAHWPPQTARGFIYWCQLYRLIREQLCVYVRLDFFLS